MRPHVLAARLALCLLIQACAVSPPDPATTDAALAARVEDFRICGPDQLQACEPDSPLLDAYRSDVDQVSLLETGPEALTARLHLIRNARHSIRLQSFIWVDDEIGRLIFAELVAAAARGVEVRVLLDQLYSLGDAELAADLVSAHPRLEIRLYNPTGGELETNTLDFATAIACCLRTFNARMHNKLLVVDGKAGITGGRNISDRYFDADPEFNYYDREVLALGPVAEGMRASFDAYWEYERVYMARRLTDVAAVITDPAYVPRSGRSLMRIPESLSRFHEGLAGDPETGRRLRDALHSVERAAYFSDPPGKPFARQTGENGMTREMYAILSAAREEVMIQTPYLVFSGRAMRLFDGLRESEPQLRVRVSTNSLASTDAFPVYAVSYKQRRRFVKDLGFEIYEMRPNPRHMDRMIPGLPGLRFSEQEGAAGYDCDYEAPSRGRRGVRGMLARRIERACEETGVEPDEVLPVTGVDGRLSLHGKSFVVDRRVGWIGSHNFDPRSDSINTESGLIFWSEEVASELARTLERDMAPENSWVAAKRRQVPVISYFSDLVAAVSRALPVFDVWPFRYTTLYELRDGAEPASPQDPDFHERYEPVGDFPEVALTLKQAHTLLVSAMGGWGAPVL